MTISEKTGKYTCFKSKTCKNDGMKECNAHKKNWLESTNSNTFIKSNSCQHEDIHVVYMTNKDEGVLDAVLKAVGCGN